MKRYRKRPSRIASAMAVIVGLGMVFFAITSFSGHFLTSGGSLFGASFLIFWVIVVVGVIGYHAYNALTGKGYSESIDFEDDDETKFDGIDSRPEGPQSIEDRLSVLSRLRLKGVISDDEYAEKRRQILDEI